MKKWIVSSLVLLVVILSVAVLPNFIKDTTIVYEGDDYIASLTTSSAVKTVFSKEKTRKMENTVDVIREFDVKLFGKDVGTYSIVERTLGNGAVFLFERLENDGLFGFNMRTTISFKAGVDLDTKNWNPITVDHPHHNVFGEDPTVNPYGRITATSEDHTLELLVGNQYVSKAMVKEYDNRNVSKIRELDREFQDIEINDDVISRSARVGSGKIAESWILVAEEPLFSTKVEEDDYIDFALHNQVSQLNWLTMDGPYTKLPFSIEPATKMGYGRVIGRIEDDLALEWFEKSGSVFFETMVLNSRVNLLYYIDEFEGTRWPSEYTSTWLGNAYGVRAPYVDTRYNEFVSFFLDKTAQTFKGEVTGAELYVPVYADYLLSRVEAGEIIETGDGYLIVDYFDEDPKTPVTHASLNHELGGLKVLLTAFSDTSEQKYMDASKRVMAGIESFGQEDGGWIRENGDLWYQARPDGTFSGDDYPQLTLLDLLETQKLLEKMKLPRNAYFDEMIDAKLGYLESEDAELIEKVTNLLEK